MAHPRLVRFFNGAVNELRSAYEKSEGTAAAIAGSLREKGVRRAIEHGLPGSAMLYPGEVIDGSGGQTGQLDGIIVHASGGVAATMPEDDRTVLAEGVLAVVESKSNLKSQWGEVCETWRKVASIRRWKDRPRGVWSFGGPFEPAAKGLPFIVIGRTGWRKPQKLAEKAIELFEMFGDENAPPIHVIQVGPPAGMGFVRWLPVEGAAPTWTHGWKADKRGVILDEEERWRALGEVWATVTHYAQRSLVVAIDWPSYLA